MNKWYRAFEIFSILCIAVVLVLFIFAAIWSSIP